MSNKPVYFEQTEIFIPDPSHKHEKIGPAVAAVVIYYLRIQTTASNYLLSRSKFEPDFSFKAV